MEAIMVCEMRFQTVDPAKRAEYGEIYRDAVAHLQTKKSHGGFYTAANI
jgi:hypothetical protein